MLIFKTIFYRFFTINILHMTLHILRRLLLTLLITLQVFLPFLSFPVAFLLLRSLYSPNPVITPLAILYLLWVYLLDRHTPERGGRRCVWFRRLRLWRYLRDYFPVSLVKTAELPADRHYIFCVHPHGAMSYGAVVNFCTEATGFSDLFPGITPHLLSLKMGYRIPMMRDIILLAGACCVSGASIDYLLLSPLAPAERCSAFASAGDAHRTRGSQAAVIVVGGQHEMLDARPGSFRLTLRDRRGFVRKALEHGADLVPVFSFGENNLMEQVANPVGRCAVSLHSPIAHIVQLYCTYFLS